MHECVQILHHAYVYDLKMILLLIGDTKGTILRGVLVSFDDVIMRSYGCFLEKCFDESLSWAYARENDGLDDRLVTSLDYVKPFLPSGVVFDSFQEYFHLWEQATS